MKTNRVLKVFNDQGKKDRTLKTRILDTAESRFMKYGFTKTTADELSAELGISKATLYKYFPSKDQILREVAARIMRSAQAEAEKIIFNKDMDFVEKLVQLMTYLGQVVSRIGSAFAIDLQRHAPDVWEEIDKFRREKILVNFKSLIAAGIREGVFRKEVNLDILVLMYMNTIQGMLNPDMVIQSRFSASEIFETVFTVYFGGIFTDMGRKKFLEKKGLFVLPGKEDHL